MGFDPQFPLYHAGAEPTVYGEDAGLFPAVMPTMAPFVKRAAARASARGFSPQAAGYAAQNQSHGSAQPELGSPPASPEQRSPNGSEDARAADATPGDKESEQQKRPRACEGCRSLKVRCDFPADAESCKRCAKAKRQCIVTVPSRKRQRKTDSKVADLERRINDLTSALKQQQQQLATGSGARARHATASMEEEDSDALSQREPSSGPAAPLSWKKRKSSFISDVSSPLDSHFPLNMPLPAPTAEAVRAGHEYADVIDRGLLRAEEVAVVFEHYVAHMAPQLPVVVFPANTRAGTVRKTRPVLFLAILCVGSGQFFPDKQRALTREALKSIADRVLCRREKALELVQAMQVLSIWLVSEDAQDTAAFQLIQSACSLAISLEINGMQLRSGLGFSLGPDRRPAKPLEEAHALEQRRAWLGCFVLSGIISQPLRQLNSVRWTSHLDECSGALQAAAAAGSGVPSDIALCKAADVQRISDRVAELASSAASPEGNKRAARTELASIANKLGTMQKEMESNPNPDVSLSLQLHESQVHTRVALVKAEDNTTPATKPAPLGARHAEALQAMVRGIHQQLDALCVFLERADAAHAAALPPFHLQRAAYALVALIVLHCASEGKPATPSLRADLHIVPFLARLQAALAAAAESARPLRHFQQLVGMLRAWFERAAPRPPRPPPMAVVTRPVPLSRPASPRRGYRKLSVPGAMPLELDSPVSLPPEQWPVASNSTAPPWAPLEGFPLDQPGYEGFDLDGMGAWGMPPGYADAGLEAAMGLAMGAPEGPGFGALVDDFFGGPGTVGGEAPEWFGMGG